MTATNYDIAWRATDAYALTDIVMARVSFAAKCTANVTETMTSTMGIIINATEATAQGCMTVSAMLQAYYKLYVPPAGRLIVLFSFRSIVSLILCRPLCSF